MNEWQDYRYSSTDGLKLAGRKYGWQHRDTLPVVCLSGLSRNSADFHELAMYISAKSETPRRVLCLDYRGRGNSEYDKDWGNYNVVTEANDVVQGMIAAGLEHAAFIGTSRGGLILMALSAMKPSLMRAIVLNDIGPEIDGPGLVRIKKSLEGGLGASNWFEAGQMLKATGKKQFPKWDDGEWERQAHFVFKEEKGKFIRNYDPKLLNTLAAIDLDVRLPSLWPQFTGLSKIPMMLIRGERTDLLAEKTVSKMRDIHPAMELVRVEDQGHAPDLGSEGLPAKIDDFFTKHAH